MSNFYFSRRGFTLIELLVVVAIIGILASLITAVLSDARSKSRDTQRISDIRQMRTALELHHSTLGGYPAVLDTIEGTEYITEIPVDPRSGDDYTYFGISCNGSICSNYHFGASLEKNNSVLESDSDFNSTPLGGFDGSDTSFCSSGDTGERCYDLFI